MIAYSAIGTRRYLEALPDPRTPEWRPMLAAHMRLWQRIADNQRRAGSPVLYITPEFGPHA